MSRRAWHPFYKQLIERDFGSVLTVRSEVPVGELPLRLDFLLLRRHRDPTRAGIFRHMGRRIAHELKGPGDRVDRVAAEKLDAVATLWRIRRRGRLLPRDRLDLVLAGSRFEPGLREGAWPDLVGLVECEPGVQRGWFHGYRLFLVDVDALALSRDTAAAAMMTDEPRRAGHLLDFLLAEKLEYHVDVFYLLHKTILKERLSLMGLTFEELKALDIDWAEFVRDYGGIAAFLKNMHAKEHIPEWIEELGGIEEVLRGLGGLEAVLRALGREDLARLVKRDPPA